jgi:16S rRNA (cytosine967-C5)-methyltransferase
VTIAVALHNARQVARSALQSWRTGREFADSIIGRLLDETKLTDSDRAFALELFYGVLRNLSLLDLWIGSLRRARLDVDLRDILQLGLYQILLSDTSEHAAVYETVELAPKTRRGVINGILRNALRQKAELLEKAKSQALHVRTSHPEFLIERWEKNFGSENAENLCLWNNQPPPIYARINRLKIDKDEFLETYPGSRSLPHHPDFVEFRSFERDALASGHCYVQDPSTALACRMVEPRPGETILDACAAPGGKTAYMAQLMENRGLIVACDRDPKRIALLEKNVSKLGVQIARTVCCEWVREEASDEIKSLAPFDRILIDAPCSNTGVMRRRVDVRWRLTPEDFDYMARQQMSILRNTAPLLKRGGVLVYSTCSLEPEENEGIVAQIVPDTLDLSRIQHENVLPFRDHFDGAFVAKFVRTG